MINDHADLISIENRLPFDTQHDYWKITLILIAQELMHFEFESGNYKPYYK